MHAISHLLYCKLFYVWLCTNHKNVFVHFDRRLESFSKNLVLVYTTNGKTQKKSQDKMIHGKEIFPADEMEIARKQVRERNSFFWNFNKVSVRKFTLLFRSSSIEARSSALSTLAQNREQTRQKWKELPSYAINSAVKERLYDLMYLLVTLYDIFRRSKCALLQSIPSSRPKRWR